MALPAAALAAAAGSSSARPLRILAFGDSLTAGWTSFSSGDTPGFAPHLQRALATHHQLAAEVTAAGAPGRAAAQSLPPLKQELASSSFDAVLLLLGANDLLPFFGGSSPPPSRAVDVLVQHLQSLHAAVRASGATSIALSLLDHPMIAHQPGGQATLQAINRRIASEVEADAHVDGEALLKASQHVLWSSDQIHLQSEGYAELGRRLATPLAEILLERVAGAGGASNWGGGGGVGGGGGGRGGGGGGGHHRHGAL